MAIKKAIAPITGKRVQSLCHEPSTTKRAAWSHCVKKKVSALKSYPHHTVRAKKKKKLANSYT